MKLTVLADNMTYIDQYYLGEPAVSYFIEGDGKRILFDTGYSDVFLQNAEKMGIDLSSVTDIVLSHGHNDHTGGLPLLMERFDLSQAVLHTHPDAFLPKREGGLFIGMPCTEEDVRKHIRCDIERGPRALSPHFLLLGEVPRQNSFEAQEPMGDMEVNGQWRPDAVLDDTALVYHDEKGLFIITGCSHSGICNILSYAKDICRDDRITGVIGGFHLFAAGPRLDKTVQYLASCQGAAMYPCHCVSLAAKCAMAAAFPIHEVGVGLAIEL